MRATGIVRRIDDLGRVVIPKEIRRTMRIRESDPLEIYVGQEGEIILKKYSPIGELGDFSKEYAESINESLDKIVFITDRDNIIAVSGAAKKDFLNKSIGHLVEKSMQERRTFTNNHAEKNQTSKEGSIIADDRGEEIYRFMGEVIAPIINQGDPIGTVIICSKDHASPIGTIETKIAETAAAFLAKQLEQ
ncbi:MAG: stage V sporulation protein T [Bacillota bacterium]|jgi:AbrB family transcriptional regulator (stage V sporulation protein T)